MACTVQSKNRSWSFVRWFIFRARFVFSTSELHFETCDVRQCGNVLIILMSFRITQFSQVFFNINSAYNRNVTRDRICGVERGRLQLQLNHKIQSRRMSRCVNIAF